ncbi:hypothetical protein J4573_21380 [Actinomadura barringtoniae]|uniref:Secreted protein n=1 Tax=Actinomadura barringtoniae TaxID=1427535 RepID=A0A939PC38_9ACTN|nr:hypothetical protein [Actinomadura barringtoniae]MBO2449668.1 hypothetical protein [Actinomadura barringtoniae]
MTGTMRIPRSRGALSGVLLLLLGLWGGLLPFVGPYFDFGFSPDDTWVYDTARLELVIAPAIAVGLGGLIVLSASNRAFAIFGAWLAVLGGAWFAVGPIVAVLWDPGTVGTPLGDNENRQVAEQLAGFTGLGVVAVFFAALALGRFAVVGVKEAHLAEERMGHGDGTTSGTGRGTEPDHGPDSGTTQPLARTFGRFSRHSPTASPPPPPPPEPMPARHVPAPGDERVAGQTGEDWHR